MHLDHGKGVELAIFEQGGADRGGIFARPQVPGCDAFEGRLSGLAIGDGVECSNIQCDSAWRTSSGRLALSIVSWKRWKPKAR